MTVDELLKTLQELSKDGKGDYPIVGAADAEGNGFRLLPEWVTEGRFAEGSFGNGEFVDEDTLQEEIKSGDGEAYDNYTKRVVCIG